MHKPKSVLVNETNKILWDFEMQTYYLTPARWPDLVIINKKKKKKICRLTNFGVSANHKKKMNESKKKDKYL